MNPNIFHIIRNRVLFGIHPSRNVIGTTKINSVIAAFWRFKSGKIKNSKGYQQDEDSDSDSEDNVIAGKGTEVKTSFVSSMRADIILKAGLGIARNKIETGFYESKIRINSKKIYKKSAQVQIGDEIDLIKGPSPTNTDFIVVGRVEVLSAKPRSETDDIQLKIRRSKSLIIENYPDGDPWRLSEGQT